jgi:hypothetical protein
VLFEVEYNEVNRNLSQHLQQPNEPDINHSHGMRLAKGYRINQVALDNDSGKAYDGSHKVDSKHEMIDGGFVGDFAEGLAVSEKRLPTNRYEHQQVPDPHGVRVVHQLPGFAGLLLSCECE